MRTSEETEVLNAALKFDCLKEAEKITGHFYQFDKETAALGFALLSNNSKLKEFLLNADDDTCFLETETSYLRKTTAMGFKTLTIIDFKNKDNITRRQYIMFHEELSILLSWDTFTWLDDGSWAKSGKKVPEPSRNAATIFCNWVPNATVENYKLSEKDFEKNDVQNINTDGREALKFFISEKLKNGIFLKMWVYQPFMWLLNYCDTSKGKEYDYEAINKERMLLLPEYVQTIINPKIN